MHGVEILGFYDLTGVVRYLEGKTSGIEMHMEENEKILEESEYVDGRGTRLRKNDDCTENPYDPSGNDRRGMS